jgi:hypothetical protein
MTELLSAVTVIVKFSDAGRILSNGLQTVKGREVVTPRQPGG